MDTIVSLATASGLGSVSIIRLSGTKAYDIAKKFTNKDLKPRYAHYLKLYHQDEFIDEAIIIYFKAPFSYTGEDVVEFQTHGSLIVCNTIIEILVSYGAKIARAGEFSKRAVLNGKISLEKALSINDLIHAKSKNAAKIIAKNLEGRFEKLLSQIRHDLVTTLAYIETAIDYAEDGIPDDVLDNARYKLEQNAKTLKDIYILSEQKKGLIEGFKIALVGKPNVGKSSILNAFLQNDRAIVSDIAGTTRDSIEEQILLDGFLVKLVDTAGIRKSGDIIESIGIEKSIQSIHKSDIILAIFDISKDFDDEDKKILELIKQSDKKVFIILNKIDLDHKINEILFNGFEVIKISANQDINEVKIKLIDYFKTFSTDEVITSSAALINACKISSNAISAALEHIKEEMEISAFYLNQALEQIELFTNKFKRDEILDEMFSHFCLGK